MPLVHISMAAGRSDEHLIAHQRAMGITRTVLLPAGWTVSASSIPSQISEDPDGRQRLYFENPRPDEIQVLIRARKIR